MTPEVTQAWTMLLNQSSLSLLAALSEGYHGSVKQLQHPKAGPSWVEVGLKVSTKQLFVTDEQGFCTHTADCDSIKRLVCPAKDLPLCFQVRLKR